jgi:hypothetical protein
MQVNSVSAAGAGLALRDRLSEMLATRPAEARERHAQDRAERREDQVRSDDRRKQEFAQAGYGAQVDLYM